MAFSGRREPHLTKDKDGKPKKKGPHVPTVKETRGVEFRGRGRKKIYLAGKCVRQKPDQNVQT